MRKVRCWRCKKFFETMAPEALRADACAECAEEMHEEFSKYDEDDG
jgi:rRNA maturation endonuclease Nob1